MDFAVNTRVVTVPASKLKREILASCRPRGLFKAFEAAMEDGHRY